MKSTFTHVITCFDFFFSLTVDSLLNARGNNIRKKSREAHLADFKTSFLFFERISNAKKKIFSTFDAKRLNRSVKFSGIIRNLKYSREII